MFKKILRTIVSAVAPNQYDESTHPFPELIPFEKLFDKALKDKRNVTVDMPLKLVTEENWPYLKSKYPMLVVPENHPAHRLYHINKKKADALRVQVESGDPVYFTQEEERVLRVFYTPAKEEDARIFRAEVIEMAVAGLKYHDYKLSEVREMLEMREYRPLSLAIEPDNKHDEFAVRVEYEGYRIGYVPAAFNYRIFTVLQQNRDCPAWVTFYKPTGIIADRVQMAVRINGD